MAIGDKAYTVEINDSELEREGWKRGRYKGTKLIGAKISKFSPGDITYGKEPVIEQYTKTVYVFSQVDNSFEANAGIFYPTLDEFNQTLNDKIIVGSARFVIDRAVTFTVGDPRNFSQIEPGVNEDDPSFHYFDTLFKKDLSLFNSCSVRFFDNANNGFVKPKYEVVYNKGEFKPAAALFQSASTATEIHAALGENNFDYELSDDARLYINPNVEDWFISTDGSSGSEGTLNTGLSEAITIDHQGDKDAINSMEGYFFGLSSRLGLKEDSYYISFYNGIQGPGVFNEKNLLRAFDIHELEDSGSNINLTNNEFTIKTLGRFGHTFKDNYDGAKKEEFVLFREKKLNNVVHLNFNSVTEAPAGVGNGGVILPENLHPAIKESLNVYLGNAGLGAQGGTTAQFGLGNQIPSVNSKAAQQQATGRISSQGSPLDELAEGAVKRGTAALQTQLQASNLQIFNLSKAQAANLEAFETEAKAVREIAESAEEAAEQAELSAAEAADEAYASAIDAGLSLAEAEFAASEASLAVQQATISADEAFQSALSAGASFAEAQLAAEQAGFSAEEAALAQQSALDASVAASQAAASAFDAFALTEEFQQAVESGDIVLAPNQELGFGNITQGNPDDNEDEGKDSYGGIDEMTKGEAESDRRLKENIIYLRKSPLGIPIYKFNYIGKPETYTGTMAQDLLKLGLNKAVVKNSNGYYSVKYNLIDVDMKQI